MINEKLFFRILRRRLSNLPKFDSITGLMFGSIIIPLTVLSLAPHQEPRFLIPLTLPLIFLKGMKMNNKTEDTEYSFRNLFGNRFSKKMIFVWYVNIYFFFSRCFVKISAPSIFSQVLGKHSSDVFLRFSAPGRHSSLHQSRNEYSTRARRHRSCSRSAKLHVHTTKNSANSYHLR